VAGSATRIPHVLRAVNNRQGQHSLPDHAGGTCPDCEH
jgi:hypothetical protein